MKSKRKWLSVFFFLVIFVLTIFPSNVLAGETTTSEGFVWDTYGNSGNIRIVDYIGNDTEVVIPSTIDGHPVIRIEDQTFKNNKTIESIVLPDTITSLGKEAFADCTSLKNINIPKSVMSFGIKVFYNCSSLESLFIPKGLSVVGDNAYEGCTSLKTVSFEKGMEVIPNRALYKCTGVENIIIPDGIKEISSNAFSSCVNLKSVTLPESLIKIGNFAFSNCDSLTEVKLPNKLEEIGTQAFYGCDALQSIYVPKSLTTLDQNVFGGCSNLSQATYEKGIEKIPMWLFHKCDGMTNPVIPNTVKVIGKNAFRDIETLESVTIPDSVTIIEDSAFYDCVNLTTVNMSKNLTELGGSVFRNCKKLESIFIPKTIKTAGENGPNFYYCDSLKTITIEDGLKVIPDSLFDYCTGIEEIEIPDSVTTIGHAAFINCFSLKSIYLSDNVTNLETQAFAGCSELTDVRLGRGITTLMPGIFDSCWQLETLYIPYTVKIIKSGALYDNSLRHIYIPSSVKTIEEDAISLHREAVVYGRPGSAAERYVENATFKETIISANSLSIDKKSMKLMVGGSFTIGYYLDELYTIDDMVWSSSNESIAIVSDEGVVTAKKPGEAEITFTVGELSQTCVVTVVQPVQTITLGENNIEVLLNKTHKLKTKVLPDNASNKTLKWTTSNAKVATVDKNGVITATGYGTAVITATAMDGSKVAATCKVTVPYTISYKLNGGKNDTTNPATYYNKAVILKNPSRNGYTFKGWYTEDSFKNKVTQLTKGTKGNKTFYAKWVPNTYNIKFIGNGNTSGKMSTFKATYDIKVTLTKNAFKRNGYTFVGWNTKADGSGKSYDNKAVVRNLKSTNGDTIKLYAQWQANNYKIAFYGNGATSGKMSTLKVTYDKKVTLTKNTFKRTGYKFVGWNTAKDGSGKSYDNKEKVKNLTSADGKTVKLYAQWKKVKYTIKYVLNDGKNNKNNPSSYYVTTSTIKLKEPTRKGYTFQGWYTDKKFKNKITKITKGSTGDIKLYAKWKKKK